jgi:hypothetical protein
VCVCDRGRKMAEREEGSVIEGGVVYSCTPSHGGGRGDRPRREGRAGLECTHETGEGEEEEGVCVR